MNQLIKMLLPQKYKLREVIKHKYKDLYNKWRMSGKSIEMLTEEQRKLHEEFTHCQNWEEVEEFLKKVEMINESQENNEIPYYDMTIEEYRQKFNTTSYEDMKKKMWM